MRLKPSAPGARERGKQERRKRILDAARRSFTERGFASTTIQEIAGLAGVAAGTVFLYARSKEELLVLSFSADVGQAVAVAEEGLPGGEATTLDQLMHLFQALITYHFGLGRPLTATLLRELMYGSDPETNTTIRRSDELLARIVERGRSRRELRARLGTPEAREILFSLFHWQLAQWAAGRVPDEELVPSIRNRIETCLRGLGP